MSDKRLIDFYGVTAESNRTRKVAIPKKGHLGVFQLREDLGTLDALYISYGNRRTKFRNLFWKLPRPYQTHELAISRVELLRDQTPREVVYHPLQFHKHRQLFIGTHDETLSVAAMHVSNPDCATVDNHG